MYRMRIFLRGKNPGGYFFSSYVGSGPASTVGYFQNVMHFSEKCADPAVKSRIMLAAIHRGLHCLPKCLLKSGESTNGKLAIDCKSGRKLRHTQHVSPCSKYSNVFALTLCMLSNVFFCPKHFLNLTYLSPSGPARRFAETDLGLTVCMTNLRHFHFKMIPGTYY